MIPGVGGRLVTASFIRDLLPDLAPERPPASFGRALESWWDRTEAALGPASSVRAIVEIAAVPLLHLLDLSPLERDVTSGACRMETSHAGRPGPPVVVLPWNDPLVSWWRPAVLHAVAADARWALCFNGRTLRIVDARQTWSRRYLEFDLAVAGRHEEAAWALWALARGASVCADSPLLDRAVEESARYGRAVCRALGDGVLEALALLLPGRHERPTTPQRRRDTADSAACFDHAVTVLYRVLFLLFAEARGLVPIWHTVYRERYSLDAIVSALLEGRPCRGLWQAVQAISRLAHSGCVAGDLRVNAFNGGLFSASYTAAMERRVVSDDVMARTIAALGTTPASIRRTARMHRLPPAASPIADAVPRVRIIYRDLDVEQLGAVYERLLEHQPAAGDDVPKPPTRDVRKDTGTFYTPRPLTSALVRRTLAPLVEGRSAEEILALRVVDPAMGSGAFLVAACRYLAAAVEDALVREGRWHAGDVTPADRAALRREVALRCIYGVDLNPMAVQLARLSLWLATLAADRPLSFLDHHLVAGDSLVGAWPHDPQRQPSGTGGRRRRSGELPLFPDEDLHASLSVTAERRIALALTPDESAAIVRDKERTLAELQAADTPVRRWSRLLDLWCAGWFWGEDAPGRALFFDLGARILGGHSSLPEPAAGAMLERCDAIAKERRFLHWPLVFPEVFTGSRPGFDAVIGNPPWDMVRGDSGDDALRRSRRALAAQLTSFVRESGVYRVETRAHVNRYQLFLERALQLVRPGGRIGLVLPSGIASDAGAAALRRHLLDRADVDTITGLTNAAAVFPIHRSVRFVLLTCTAGRPTQTVRCRFGLSRPEELESEAAVPLIVSRSLLGRISGDDDLGIPEVASAIDLRIVERISAAVPRLGAADGWSVTFGRELNASDDRSLLQPATGVPGRRLVVEGKQVEPFRVDLAASRFEVRPGVALPREAGTRARLAYRDVASATNRLTLIAAIVPARAVTTHTLFCLRTPLDRDEQLVLCALLNSFVANYLIRLRVNTHVTVSLVQRLPVPVVRPAHPHFDRLVALAQTLARDRQPAETLSEYVDIQACAAVLYGVGTPELEHVLSTFPLVETATKEAVLVRFRELERG